MAEHTIEETVTIINMLGLHARASAKLVDLTKKYPNTSIKIRRNNKTVDGKSIMGVMTLAASQGTQLELLAAGEQAAALIEAIKALINRRFDESE
jgi:phosphocarrier protein HPr